MAEPAAEPPEAADLKLRMVEPGDEPAILKMHQAVYGTPLNPDLLRWKIRYNIDRLAANGFDGYGAGVVVVKDNRIVGFNSYQTRRLGLGGQEILAAESGTTMVLREFRWRPASLHHLGWRRLGRSPRARGGPGGARSEPRPGQP